MGRGIEERDRHFVAELRGLEGHIQHNTGRIAELRDEMERRFAELRDEMERRFSEVERRFVEARDDRQAIREEMRQGFTELRGEIGRLDTKIDAHFRWTIGLMIPIVLGMLAIIVRVFLLGPIP